MAYNPKYKGKKYSNQQQDMLQVVVLGIFRLFWFLITLPFKGIGKSRRQGLNLENKNYIASKRHEIEDLVQSENLIELKHAVIEADKLVDFVLRSQGFAGDTFADRLRSAQGSMPPSLYNQLWEGHKIRNQIAHENELRIMNQELREAVEKLFKYIKTI